MSAPKYLPDKAIADALRKSGGIKTTAAKMLGISRQDVHYRIVKSEKLQKVVAETKDVLLDLCEAAFVKAIEGDPETGDGADLQTARWYAERMGKARGYANKTETTFDTNQIEAIVASLGGDPDKFRAALLAMGENPD